MRLPHEVIKGPLRAGMRDVRATIRDEARAGAFSERVFGGPSPAMGMARLMDDFLNRTEDVGSQLLGLDRRDSLGSDLHHFAGALSDPSPSLARYRALFRLAEAVRQRLGPPDAVIHERRLVLPERMRAETLVERGVEAAMEIAAGQPIQRRIAPARERELPDDIREVNERAALALVMAALIHRQAPSEAAIAAVDGACRVVESEYRAWSLMLRNGGEGSVVRDWERILPYLP